MHVRGNNTFVSVQVLALDLENTAKNYVTCRSKYNLHSMAAHTVSPIFLACSSGNITTLAGLSLTEAYKHLLLSVSVPN